MRNEQQVEEQNFVEEVGIVLEQTGLPRMAGRVLGRLLISNPPHQSTDELTEALMTSKGSISTATRDLIQIGLVERISLPGVRHGYFSIQADAWKHMIRRNIVGEIEMVRQLAERGLKLMENTSPRTPKWLAEMLALYTSLEWEVQALLERWEQETKKGKSSAIHQAIRNNGED